MQTVLTLIRRCRMQCLIRVYTVCQGPFYGTLGINELSIYIFFFFFFFHHWGVQLILAYSWARPAILVVGKGRGGMFLFLLFLHFHSCSSFFLFLLFHTFIPVPPSSLFLSFISSTISSITLLPFSGRRHKMTHKG